MGQTAPGCLPERPPPASSSRQGRSRTPAPGRPRTGLAFTQPSPQRTVGDAPVGGEATVDVHGGGERDAVPLNKPLPLSAVPRSLLDYNRALTSQLGNDVPRALAKVSVVQGQQRDLEGHGGQVRPASARR